jgi:hypothetical protein
MGPRELRYTQALIGDKGINLHTGLSATKGIMLHTEGYWGQRN